MLVEPCEGEVAAHGRWTLDDAGVLLDDLCAIPGRGACTDAERRAARALAAELERARPRGVGGDPLGAAALGARRRARRRCSAVAGSLLSVAVPLAGVILGAVAAACLALEAAGRQSPLRWLGRRRATQDVVVAPPTRATA